MTVYEEQDIKNLPGMPLNRREYDSELLSIKLDKIFNQTLVHGEAEGIAYHFEGKVDELQSKYNQAKELYRILKKIDSSARTTERDEKMEVLYDAQDLAKKLFGKKKSEEKSFPGVEEILNKVYEK